MSTVFLKDQIEPLLAWFAEHARTLPWRSDPTPYHVWLSEIMLQQTRVEAVKPYYERFLAELPDVYAFAECPEDRLLKLWEGLGYYSRVRNMKKAAGLLVTEYDGMFPTEEEKLRTLPGIGPYTAGAIASIAFGRPAPAVDGNVLRVLARLRGDERDITQPGTKRDVEGELRTLYTSFLGQTENGSSRNPGTINQALMELGALVCLPNGEPHCDVCPWQSDCITNQQGLWRRIPVKEQKRARKTEERTVLLILRGGQVALRKRPRKGLLAGLYELPNVTGHLSRQEVTGWLREQGLSPVRIEKLPKAKHIFTHVEWHMTGYRIFVRSARTGELIFETCDTVKKEYAIPAAFGEYLPYMDGAFDGQESIESHKTL